MTQVEIITPPVADETNPLDHFLVTLTEAIAQIDRDVVAHGPLGGEFGYGARYENGVFVMRPFYWGDCDCGWMELEEAWAEKHTHAIDCYWTVSHRVINESPLQKAREDAIAARNRLPWLSPEAEEAQKKVIHACDLLKAFEEKVRRDLCAQHGIPWNNGWGSAVHCTCEYEKAWQEFLKEHPGHRATCSLELPNFQHKASGLEVRWYKWIGRDTKAEIPEGADLPAVFAECVCSLSTGTSPPTHTSQAR